jgi:hypothetical protein
VGDHQRGNACGLSPRCPCYGRHGGGAATPALDQSFLYDKNSQLTDISLYATAWHIDYDANGNRTAVTIGTNTRTYGTEMVAGTTTPKSNRLKTLSNPAASLTHLATGTPTARRGCSTTWRATMIRCSEGMWSRIRSG